MSFSRSTLALFAALWCGAAEPEAGLTYRARFRDAKGSEPVEIRFRVHLENAKPRRSRHPRPRFGTWRLEALEVPASLSTPLVMARMERMLYLAPPSEAAAPEDRRIRLGSRRLRLWQLLGGVSADLVELRGGLLALFRLRGDFPPQGLQDLDLRLERADVPKGFAPPQQGDALLGTLRDRLVAAPLSTLGPEVVR